jgi:SAM-dependent methyltransferase
MAKLAAAEVATLDPYKFMATIGKRVIHPGGRASTGALLARAGITGTSRVLDVGCGVATTAIQIARRYGAHVTAVDISPLMLERAAANARAAKVTEQVTVREGDICALPFTGESFDVVIAEAVTMFADRRRAAAELARVCAPGGRVLATEFCWRTPPSAEAREVFLGQVCPGMSFDTIEDWLGIYASAGLTNLETETGRFQMMTPRGFLADEGLARCLAIMAKGKRPAGQSAQDGLAHAPHGQSRPLPRLRASSRRQAPMNDQRQTHRRRLVTLHGPGRISRHTPATALDLSLGGRAASPAARGGT